MYQIGNLTFMSNIVFYGIKYYKLFLKHLKLLTEWWNLKHAILRGETQGLPDIFSGLHSDPR